ncbi:hypothetical protein PORY_002069 [Pneumocystis oryctolagi]|uniref:Uncharacterized protein n=1 Tax=Pneumocystis oryctolagi TaxID=42067 RepID=A0ACB7CAV2_9ASCO|nr:hypothetical protein PORY_002069 [Pneumocystis oryctolagi]
MNLNIILRDKLHFFEKKNFSHSNLKTFFKYAQNLSLNPESSYYKGIFYEYIVQKTLRKYNMDLWRSGGTNDCGIDLRGKWYYEIGQIKYQCPIIVQCKNQKKKIGPKCVRELEGVLSNENENILGLISCCGFTQIAQKQMLKASKAMAMCVILPKENDGYLEKFIWNIKASELIKGLGVQFRYIQKTSHTSIRTDVCQELVLTINGHIIKYQDFEGY